MYNPGITGAILSLKNRLQEQGVRANVINYKSIILPTRSNAIYEAIFQVELNPVDNVNKPSAFLTHVFPILTISDDSKFQILASLMSGEVIDSNSNVDNNISRLKELFYSNKEVLSKFKKTLERTQLLKIRSANCKVEVVGVLRFQFKGDADALRMELVRLEADILNHARIMGTGNAGLIQRLRPKSKINLESFHDVLDNIASIHVIVSGSVKELNLILKLWGNMINSVISPVSRLIT